jgi:hypothetical protein
MHKGRFLGCEEELTEADLLRQACHDALCRTRKRSNNFPDARKQIIYGYGDVKEYCRNLAKSSFWGGEVEMMVITKMLKVPIFVYQSKAETSDGCALPVPLCCRTALVLSHARNIRRRCDALLLLLHVPLCAVAPRPHRRTKIRKDGPTLG